MIFYKICKFSLEKTLTENVLKILDEKKISWEYIWRIFYKYYNKIFFKKAFCFLVCWIIFFYFCICMWAFNVWCLSLYSLLCKCFMFLWMYVCVSIFEVVVEVVLWLDKRINIYTLYSTTSLYETYIFSTFCNIYALQNIYEIKIEKIK